MSSYKFRVLIDNDTGKEVFRDLTVSGRTDFEVFYRKIIEAFGFRGDQMASFYVSNESWDKGHEISLLDLRTGNEAEDPSMMLDTPVSAIVSGKGQRLLLVYDFLRMWCFMIECVSVLKTDVKEPRIDFVSGIAPDEDAKAIEASPGDDFDGPPELGNDIDDIFSGMDDDPLDSDEAFDIPDGSDEY